MRLLRDQVADTIALTDPVRRNLRITLSYHRILHAMTPLVGTVDVSWPAYAVWASRTVGHYVRAEEIPRLARGFVDEADLASRFLASIDADRAELGALLTLPATFLHAAIEQVTEEIPKQLGEVLNGDDAEGAKRAMQAMMQMHKLDVAALEAAYAGK